MEDIVDDIDDDEIVLSKEYYDQVEFDRENRAKAILDDMDDDENIVLPMEFGYDKSGHKFMSRESIQHSIKEFFNHSKLKSKQELFDIDQNLSWAIGGKIPEEILFSVKYYNLVRNINNKLSQAIEIGYDLIEKCKENSFASSGQYKDDLEIEMCLFVIRRCEKLHIPQEYIGGIYLMYLELCEGVKLS